METPNIHTSNWVIPHHPIQIDSAPFLNRISAWPYCDPIKVLSVVVGVCGSFGTGPGEAGVVVFPLLAAG